MVHHRIARRRIRAMFARLSQGDFEPALAGLATPFEQRFSGDHPLGGVRRSRAAFRAWFERMYRLFPDLAFEIVSTAAGGLPWDITVVAEWIDRATAVDGEPYLNQGVHVVRLRWGRIASIHAYLDTQGAAAATSRLAAKGYAEAGAPPIEG